MLWQPDEREFINVIPNHQTGFTRFTTHLEITVSLGDSWLSPQSCIPHHTEGKLVGWPEALLLKAVEGAAAQCTPGMGHNQHQEAHIPVTGIPSRVGGGGANPNS